VIASAASQWRRYTRDNYSGARAVATWKARVHAAWSRVSVRRLDRGERVEELARMLGGAEITTTTRKHAAEMLGGG